jgi:hypothetical protein
VTDHQQPRSGRRSKDPRQQVTRALQSAIAALDQAATAALLRADDVSADVEERLEVGPSDERRFQEPHYAAALEFATKVRQARELVEQLAAQQASLP